MPVLVDSMIVGACSDEGVGRVESAGVKQGMECYCQEIA